MMPRAVAAIRCCASKVQDGLNAALGDGAATDHHANLLSIRTAHSRRSHAVLIAALRFSGAGIRRMREIGTSVELTQRGKR